ncbi:MAG TPA: NADP-dependent oxidoreductase [Solirubrobacteraceae bacterium]|nr:NADP-dependent oxidoreductase [Solirubrobacteraceae bacterium]
MRVCEVIEFGGPDVLRISERPQPVAQGGEVVVEVVAANVNPSDLAARSGALARRMEGLEAPFVPGWDLSGVIADAGDGRSGFSVGDPVVGIIPWIQTGGRVGAYAEAVAVDPAWLALRPERLDPVAAATVPLNALTARQGLDLIEAPGVTTVLITGASGAVGGFATQLAVRDGLRVLALASEGDETWVGELGAHEVLPRGTDLRELEPLDAVLDAVPIGAAAAAAVRGGGVAVFTRRAEVRELADEVRIETPLVTPDAVVLAELVEMVAAGRLRTRVARTFDLADASGAHGLLEQGGVRGKLVLTT